MMTALTHMAVCTVPKATSQASWEQMQSEYGVYYICTDAGQGAPAGGGCGGLTLHAGQAAA